MTDAEKTVEFAILDGISSTYGQEPEKTVQAIKENLVAKDLVWATKEYIIEKASVKST